MSDFGPMLKGFRSQRNVRNVSQSKLAQRAGFDHSYISRIEAGTRHPTRDAVDAIARVLDLTTSEHDDLLAAAGYLPRNPAYALQHEPELADVYRLLLRPNVAQETKDVLRAQLGLMVRQVTTMLPEPVAGEEAA